MMSSLWYTAQRRRSRFVLCYFDRDSCENNGIRALSLFANLSPVSVIKLRNREGGS